MDYKTINPKTRKKIKETLSLLEVWSESIQVTVFEESELAPSFEDTKDIQEEADEALEPIGDAITALRKIINFENK